MRTQSQYPKLLKRYGVILALFIPLAGMAAEIDDLQQGIELRKAGSYDSAFACLSRALNLAELELNKTSQASACLQIGILYDLTDFPIRSRRFMVRAYEIYRDLGDRENEAKALNNIANNLYRSGELELAIDNWRKSIAVKKELGTMSFVVSQINLASVFYDIDSLDQAFDLASSSLIEASYVNDSAMTVAAYNTLGLVSMDRENYQMADSLFHMALTFTRKQEHREKQRVLENLQYVCENSGDYKLALSRSETLRNFTDSVRIAEVRENINLINIENELLTQQRDTAELASENKRQQFNLLLIIGSLALLSLLIYIAYQRRIALQKAQTKAVFEAREQEEKRITELLWSEIGKAMQKRGGESVFAGDQKSLEGAIQAARYLSAQHFNPYLQVSIARAITYGCGLFGEQFDVDISCETEDIDLDLAKRKGVYTVFKRALVDRLNTHPEAPMHVQLFSESGQVRIRISGEDKPPKGNLYESAQAGASVLRGKISTKQENGQYTTRISIP